MVWGDPQAGASLPHLHTVDPHREKACLLQREFVLQALLSESNCGNTLQPARVHAAPFHRHRLQDHHHPAGRAAGEAAALVSRVGRDPEQAWPSGHGLLLREGPLLIPVWPSAPPEEELILLSGPKL